MAQEDLLSIVNSHEYKKLIGLIQAHEKTTLDKMLFYTRRGEIDLADESGMNVWRAVFEHYESELDDEMSEILINKLAKIDKGPALLGFEDLLIVLSGFIGSVFTGASLRGTKYMSSKVEHHFRERGAKHFKEKYLNHA